MIQIVPNWHPIWVHFAVALLLTSTIMLLLSRFIRAKSGSLSQMLIVGRWTLVLGTVMAVLALWTGLMASTTVTHDDLAHANMMVHRDWAIAAAAIFVLATIVELIKRHKTNASWLTLVLTLTGATALTVTAFEGGQNVYEHGLGVLRLPEQSGHDHEAHDHAEPQVAPPGDSQTQALEDESPQSLDSIDEGVTKAHDHAAHDHAASSPTEPTPEGDRFTHDFEESTEDGELGSISDQLYTALASADKAAVEALLHPDVMIYESGNVESSLQEYASHHMPADMAFLKSIERSILHREVHFLVEQGAVVSTHAVLKGNAGGKDIEITSTETLVLKLIDGRWQVIHIHWSSGS